MRKSIVASVFLLGLLTGCTSRDAAPPHVPTAVGVDGTLVSAEGNSAVARPRALTAGIAALPDRGQLLAFRRDATPRRSLAYTWRPVDISEAHALHSIGGEMTVTAPDGHAIRLQYERHIEHADGNWTWVGRPAGAAPGSEAILTFGEKAVFGTIPVGEGSPLRITTGGGRTWMMETDDGAVAALPAAHPRGTDALLPPVRGSGPVGASRQAAALGAEAATSASPTVDLLIGYTSGFATRLGGQSQANTRLVNLVDITNQAYANSQVAGRVRLVKTMQVNYPDATANSAALYALTGCTETACTQVDPALQPLHVAREQYGADAISLVRNFNDPENGGCGIAWLIGGGQTTIASTDEYAAMSVVSDTNGMGGTGSFPDNGFVCRDETLAHELGHNMGSAHDVATADGDDGVLQANEYGRYPYSFGYKTGVSSGNFYTVMAYGEGGQARYRVFSNPQITYCGGLPCGVVDNADNARSLRQTMALIGAFRTPASRVRSDFDADGRSDLLWRNVKSGANQIWLSADSGTLRSVTAVPNTTWRIIESGDFNGDGSADILWHNDSTGSNQVWYSGLSTAAATLGATPAPWIAASIGDFNGDGRDDIVWRNPSTGQNTIWLSGSYTTSRAVTPVSSAGWTVVGTGDFNGDGVSDLLWRNANTGANSIWLSANSATAMAVTAVTNTAWAVAGVGDFDGDGLSDLLWRNASTGSNQIWPSASSALAQTLGAAPAPWTIAGVADFNGDGSADIFWRNTATGAATIWRSGNYATSTSVTPVSNPDWVVRS